MIFKTLETNKYRITTPPPDSEELGTQRNLCYTSWLFFDKIVLKT